MDFMKRLDEIKQMKRVDNEPCFQNIHHILMKEYGYIPMSELVGEKSVTTITLGSVTLPIRFVTEKPPSLVISTMLGLLRFICEEAALMEKELEKAKGRK